jgi:hypothetical protein
MGSKRPTHRRKAYSVKKIFVAMVFAFVFATGMAIVTVIAQID